MSGGGFEPRRAAKGLIAGRQLFAVQTFEIARLTNHVVPLVPGTFVAVSGQGPKGDSNGSGKTSFLIAVSLLLADPQWRLDVYGGKNATGVLFKPDSAGLDPAQQVGASTSGYIAGVFARQDDPVWSAITVWVRLSTSAPYFQAAWADGVRLADHDEDGGRDLQADEIWQAIKGNNTCSAKRMAETLYGDAPRCLSYLDTPLRPPVPSLLSQQMTEMGPPEIAESLIALSGSRTLLEQEQTYRGDTVNRQRHYDEVLEGQERQYAIDEAELAGIAARDSARTELAEADRHWRHYLAARYLTVLDRDRELQALLTTSLDTLTTAEQDAATAKDRLRQLEEVRDLDTAEAAARGELESARVRLRDLRDERSGLTGQKTGLEPQRDDLLEASAEWNGDSPDEAAAKVSKAMRDLTRAKLTAERDVLHHAELGERLSRAEAGRFGDAGRVIDLLEQIDVAGTALVDVVEVVDSERSRWEPRLWPWREAVVVDHEQIGDARRAVASYPGAMLVSTDPHDRQHDVGGVLCSLPITDFLSELQVRWSAHEERGVAFVLDEPSRLSVLAGFGSPVTGREQLLFDLRRQVAEANAEAERSRGAVEAAEAAHELAGLALETARAAQRLQRVETALDVIEQRLGDVEKKIGPAQTTEYELDERWQRRLGDKQGHETKVQAARAQHQEAARRENDARRKDDDLRKERVQLRVEKWRALWGGDKRGAALLIEANPAKNPAAARSAALESVTRAVTKYGLDETSPSAFPEDSTAAALRQQLAGTDALTLPVAVLDDLTASLRVRLEGHLGRDRSMRARIERDREQRSRLVQNAETELHLSQERLMTLQDMIERHLESILERVSEAFDQLDVQRGGFGAELRFTSERPTGPGDWSWQVTPRWRRSRSGPMVSYREIANGAQVKVYAVQLVLAAVLSDAQTAGRVLVLDELGNSLGEVNRKDVLGALKTVAERTQVTILGTCQDSVLVDAADVCGELMWFEHASSADALNRPTRVWGYDANGERVHSIHPWLAAGRHGG